MFAKQEKQKNNDLMSRSDEHKKQRIGEPLPAEEDDETTSDDENIVDSNIGNEDLLPNQKRTNLYKS